MQFGESKIEEQGSSCCTTKPLITIFDSLSSSFHSFLAGLREMELAQSHGALSKNDSISKKQPLILTKSRDFPMLSCRICVVYDKY